MEATTLKFVGTNKFEVALFQLASGAYAIGYEVLGQGKAQLGEAITDFNTATYMFDLKVQELEGH